VDDLDYFPGGAWLSDDDAAYRGYADPDAGWRADQHYDGGQPGNVWQRLADGPWSPLGAPVADQSRVSGEQPRYSDGGWPPAPPGGGRPYPDAPPPVGYPRAYGPDPGVMRDHGPRDWPRDSGPQDRLRDTGPRARPRDSGPQGRLRDTGSWDGLRDSGPQDWLRDSGPQADLRDSRPQDWLRDSRPQGRLRDSGPQDWARDSGPQDSGPWRPPEAGDSRHARRHTGTSLIAGYAPVADPDRTARRARRPVDPEDEPRGGASQAAGRAARETADEARSSRAPVGQPLPSWLPFGNRLVLLPKERAAAAVAGELREHRDVSGGWLRPAVFGAMDGVVTNASLIAGIGAGGGAHGMIILTGVAGLIAGAFSMATGEYISVKSQNELTQAEIELERLQHDRDRGGKLDRLTQVFMDKGVSPNLAEAVSRQISADPDRAVATHVREELGFDPDDQPSPRTAAVASFISFTIGALVPMAPFLVGYPNLEAALVLSGLFAFGGGAAVARLAGRPAFLGGLRQFAAAFLATGMAFFIGHLVGAHLG
jgi:vacuolar iron transporter family protein